MIQIIWMNNIKAAHGPLLFRISFEYLFLFFRFNFLCENNQSFFMGARAPREKGNCMALGFFVIFHKNILTVPLEFPGMGTKVLHESYFLGCYTMRDVNLDSSLNWSFCCEGSRLGGMSCDSSPWKPENGYNEYGRESLRQTMLRHEEIFRKQVDIDPITSMSACF